MSEEDEFMSVRQVADALRLHRNTVLRRIYRNDIPAWQLARRGRWRIPRAWVESEMRKMRPDILRARRRIVTVEHK